MLKLAQLIIIIKTCNENLKGAIACQFLSPFRLVIGYDRNAGHTWPVTYVS